MKKTMLGIAGALLLIYTALLAPMLNFTIGIAFTFLLGLLFLLWCIFYEKINAAAQKGFLKWLRRLIIAALLFMLSVIVFLAVYGNTSSVTYEEDALIVLGAGIRGEAVSVTLANRLDAAAEYAAQNQNALIVVSGGQGPQEAISEALAMERYLIASGVEPERIIKEDASTSTYENFLYSKEILDKTLKHPYKTAYVTNTFHLYRAGLAARAAGLDAAGCSARLEWYGVPVNYLREVLAVLKTWILGV